MTSSRHSNQNLWKLNRPTPNPVLPIVASARRVSHHAENLSKIPLALAFFPPLTRQSPAMLPKVRIWIGYLLVISHLFLDAQSSPAQSKKTLEGSRPNIIVVLTDDQGYGDTSNHGHPTLKTPNLDRLENEGRSFRNFYVSPTCAPTRSALMTGRHEFFNGVTHTILERERLRLDATTIAEVLQQANYSTGIFGKWHLGDEDLYQPQRRGFEEAFIHGAGGIGQTYPGSGGDAPDNKYTNPWILHNGVFEKTQGYCTDVFFDRAIQWMDTKRGNQPFLCWIATNAPHAPYNARPEDAARFDQEELPDNLKNFYGMIHNIDENVGRLLRQLESWGIDQQTLIVFMNDNGTALGAERFNAGMRGTKGTAWLGGTRANCFWRWPNHVEPGTCNALTAHVDLFRTFASLADAKLSENVQSQAHGKNLLSLLENPQADWEDRTLVTHLGRWPQNASPNIHKYHHAAIRNSQFTLVSVEKVSGDPNPIPSWELYDVQADPGQQSDVAQQHPEIVESLSASYEQWWNSVQPNLVNERVTPVTENPFKVRFRQQFPNPQIIHVPRTRPNILWMIVEDMSPDFACYGQAAIQTPNVDALAARGTRFTRAFVTGPICSISRSALITGRYQTSLGVQNHRSSVPGHSITLPDNAPLVSELFKNAGYHVNNLTWEAFLKTQAQVAKDPKVPIAKTDYNFEWNPQASYDPIHWSQRKEGQPFFVQVQLNGGKFRGQAPQDAWPARVAKELGSITKPESVVLPPYLPDHPVIRADWAQYLDCVRYTDHQVGKIIERLKEEGVLENTIVFFITDHGISHVRNKQFLYDGGTHVPLIVAGPGVPSHDANETDAPLDSPNAFDEGSAERTCVSKDTLGRLRTDLVEHIDLAATSLGFAGIAKPGAMQSQDIFAKNYKPREAVFAARDRADETVDWIRSVRTTRWKYIRNGFPSRPYLQPNNYKDTKAIVQAMRQLYQEGKLTHEQALIMAPTRPLEELYDLENDPLEFNNLAASQTTVQPEHLAELERLRSMLIQWQERTGDQQGIESEEIYEAEAGAEHLEGGKGNRAPAYQKNLELMRRWRTERPFVPMTQTNQ